MDNEGSDTILIVDDEPDVREALSELCELKGYDVASAENGLGALARLRTRQNRPALILLDLHMPVMDGYTFLYHVRDDSRIENVPIIVITADLAAEPFGADAIIRKPVNLEHLFEMMRRFLKPPSQTAAESAVRVKSNDCLRRTRLNSAA